MRSKNNKVQKSKCKTKPTQGGEARVRAGEKENEKLKGFQ